MSSHIHHSLLSLLLPALMGLLPLEYENTLSLNKASLNYSLFVIVCSGCDETWTWSGIIGVSKMAKLAQTKAVCLYSLGKSESSLIIHWLELISGPCFSLHLGSLIQCITGLLESWTHTLTLGVGYWWTCMSVGGQRPRTNAASASLTWKKQVMVVFHCLILNYPHYLQFMLCSFFNTYYYRAAERKKERSEETTDLQFVYTFRKSIHCKNWQLQ